MMRYSISQPALLLAGILICNHSVIAADMTFMGELIEPACTLENDKILVDMGTVFEQYIYANQRTPGTLFELRLKNCDLTHTNRVKVTFEGLHNTALPTLLAVNGGANRGIAIGLETPSGQAVPLGNTEDYPLLAGDNTLKLKAYIQGEPNALINKTIVRSAFSAIATFTLEYF
ncbi:fimbrial protein [Serratia sp. D1N4]